MTKAFESFKNLMSQPGSAPTFAGSGLAWLENERELARESFLASGLPTRKQEEWKYTSVAPIAESEITRFTRPDAQALVANAALREQARLSGPVTAELVFLNGHFVPEWSKTAQGSGVHLLPLSEALRSQEAGFVTALASARNVFASADHKGIETSFATLNTSAFEDAAVLHVGDKVRLEAPVVLTFIHNSEMAAGQLPTSHARVLAIFGKMSEASVIENHFGADNAPYFSNNVSDMHLGDSARVTYVRVQREGREAYHIGTTRAFQARDSRLESLQISLGGKLSRQDLKTRLAASGAEAVVDGLYIMRNKQHVDNHTSIEHVIGDTTSEQLYKGILDDESRAVFNGRIYIAKDAQRSNSSQLNNNLMLSLKAEIDTKPELEIFADDVKAGHGATVGRLDKEHLFYFESRAIDEETAVAMLAEGFAQDLVLRRTNESVRKALAPVVSRAVQGLKVSL